MKLSIKNIAANLAVYGVTHAVIDCVCAAVVFSVFKNQVLDISIFISLVILYNVLAFGLQTLIGLAVDHLRLPKETALLGCFLTGLSAILFVYFPISAIVIAGLGNALFHVGAGSISLNLTPKKAVAPGIFVAPGAIGLLIGTLLGKSGHFIPWQAIIILIILFILILLVRTPYINYDHKNPGKTRNTYFGLIIGLIFLSIIIRSLVGSTMIFPWKTDVNLLILLTVAIVLGKGIGGFLADKFGRIRIAVGALILSLPLLVFGASIPYIAIIGMFLFNITMPITLVAISNTLPGRPAFAFGLTCLALVLGILPILLGFQIIFSTLIGISSMILISSIALFIGLKLMNNK